MSSTESRAGTDRTQTDQEAELIALRARVAELERQLVEVEAWANRTLGAAQERLYWLDRWQLDLNRLMERPAAARVRAGLRFARSAYRLLRKLKRRLQRT
jgi:hypothetical protein